MLLHVGAGDEDVVEVDEHKVQPSTNPVRHALKGVASIAQTKRHNHKLPETEGGDDRRLGNISRVHVDLVVTLARSSFKNPDLPLSRWVKSWM